MFCFNLFILTFFMLMFYFYLGVKYNVIFIQQTSCDQDQFSEMK